MSNFSNCCFAPTAFVGKSDATLQRRYSVMASTTYALTHNLKLSVLESGLIMDIQSPINLVPTVSATIELPLKLNWCCTNGFLHYGEHGTEVIFPQPDNNSAILHTKQFVLRQFHFHHPSEHFLKGKQFDAELHIVHQNLDDCTFLVLAVLLSIGKEVDENKICAETDSAFFDAVHDKKPIIQTDPIKWIPPHAKGLLRYEGSLTTEPFSETVSWVVLCQELSITKKQFGSIFGKVEKPNTRGPKIQKARSLQPLNRRYIVEYDISIESLFKCSDAN